MSFITSGLLQSNNFEELFKVFINKRMGVLETATMRDSESREAIDKTAKAMTDFNKKLPPELLQEFNSLMDMKTSDSGIFAESAYTMGFCDAARLMLSL